MSDYDPVNKPEHYNVHPSGVECIQITEHMGFCLGNVVKYVWRADLKNDAIEDLKKAKWYLERELAKRESGEHCCSGGDGGICACFKDECECDDGWIDSLDATPPIDGSLILGDYNGVNQSSLYGKILEVRYNGRLWVHDLNNSTGYAPKKWKQPLTDSGVSDTKKGRE